MAALIAFATSVLLATDRRRALVWVGLSIIGVGVIVLIVEKVLGALVISQFESEEARAVARVFWNTFTSDIDVCAAPEGWIPCHCTEVYVQSLWLEIAPLRG